MRSLATGQLVFIPKCSMITRALSYLKPTLDEEEETDQKLNKLAKSLVNIAAAAISGARRILAIGANLSLNEVQHSQNNGSSPGPAAD